MYQLAHPVFMNGVVCCCRYVLLVANLNVPQSEMLMIWRLSLFIYCFSMKFTGDA